MSQDLKEKLVKFDKIIKEAADKYNAGVGKREALTDQLNSFECKTKEEGEKKADQLDAALVANEEELAERVKILEVKIKNLIATES